MYCGTVLRQCPKIVADPTRAVSVDQMNLPPPCVYLFPRSIPDPRNNPDPPCWKRNEVQLIDIFLNAFNGDNQDVV